MFHAEPIYFAVGARIRAQRKRDGLTQTELGELLDPPVIVNVISKIEKGLQRVQLHQLVQIAAILGLSLDELCAVERRSKKRHHPR